jgi:hypothetical protein
MVTVEPGTRLWLTIADPFELSGNVAGQVAAVHSFADGAEKERLLVTIEVAVNWSGTPYDHFVLECRTSPGLIDELVGGGSVDVNGYGVLPQGPPPWGVQRWRGGLAFVGTASIR